MIKTELEFIDAHLGTFFKVTPARDMIHDVRAPLAGWKHSECLVVPRRQAKNKSMLNDLRNHNQAPAHQAIKLNLPENRVASKGTGHYMSVKKRSTSTICYLVWAMCRGYKLLIGETLLDVLSRRFPLMNNIGNSFSELCTTPEEHKNIPFKALPIETKNSSHSALPLELFSTVSSGIYLVD